MESHFQRPEFRDFVGRARSFHPSLGIVRRDVCGKRESARARALAPAPGWRHGGAVAQVGHEPAGSPGDPRPSYRWRRGVDRARVPGRRRDRGGVAPGGCVRAGLPRARRPCHGGVQRLRVCLRPDRLRQDVRPARPPACRSFLSNRMHWFSLCSSHPLCPALAHPPTGASIVFGSIDDPSSPCSLCRCRYTVFGNDGEKRGERPFPSSLRSPGVCARVGTAWQRNLACKHLLMSEGSGWA